MHKEIVVLLNISHGIRPVGLNHGRKKTWSPASNRLCDRRMTCYDISVEDYGGNGLRRGITSIVSAFRNRNVENVRGAHLINEMSDLLKGGQPDDARTVFRNGSSEGETQTKLINEKIVSRLYKEKRYTEVRKVYRALRKDSSSLRYNTFMSALNASLRSQAIGEALEVFQDLKRQGYEPNIITYCGLISSLGKIRRRGVRGPELAYQLWKELLSSPQGSELDAVAIRTGMKACVAIGRVEEAEELLKLLKKSRKQLDGDLKAYNILLHGYATSGNLAAMINLVNEMRSKKIVFSSVTYNTLIGAYAKSGNLVKAREWMDEAIKEGTKLDAWSHTLMLKGYIEVENIAAATRILNDMESVNIKPTCVTYTALIDAHVRLGDMKSALHLLNRMLESGEVPTAVTYNSLLKGYARDYEKNAPLREALSLLEDMQAANISPTVDTLNILMSAALDKDDPKLSLDIYKRFRDSGVQPDGFTYTSLIKSHARRGELAAAVSSFESLSRDKSATLDIAAYNAMVDALARCGEMQAAEAMLDRASSFAQRAGIEPPVEAYGSIVYGYVKMNEVKAAVGAMRKFHAIGGTPDMQMLDQVADMCVRNGEFKLAMQSVRAIELLGGKADKSKYKTLFEKRMARTSQGFASTRMQQAHAQERNIHIERFKFWLGLPNKYYSSGFSDENE